MDFEKYKNKMTYPDSPVKPHLQKEATPPEIRAYANAVEQYNNDMIVYRLALDAYRRETGRLNDLFYSDLLVEHGMTTIADEKIAALLYSKAYEQGHSAGNSEIASYFAELVELAQLLEKAFAEKWGVKLP